MGRVIVADDDALVRQLLKELLEREGFDLKLCADGQAALNQVDGPAPDLWILDLEMPKASGLDVIRALRARRNLTPVLLISGAGDHPDIPAALAYSGVEHLPKPFSIKEFRRYATRLLGLPR